MRDDSYISNRRLHVPTSTYLPHSPVTFGSSPLRLFEDRRTFHPEGRYRPARSFTSSGSRFTTVDRVLGNRSAFKVDSSRSFPSLMSQTRATIAFAHPRSTLVCVRRQQRKEVLHSLNRTGRGGARNRDSRWTEYSNVRCR